MTLSHYSRRSVWTLYAVLVACYVAIVAGTKTEDFGDSRYYALNVLDYVANPHDSAALKNLFDFGQLIWGPALVPLYALTGNFYRHDGELGPFLSVVALEVAISIACGWIAISVLYILALRLRASPAVAAAMAAAFCCLYAVVDYTHSGTPYVPGVALTYVGFWLATEASGRSSRPLAAASGAAMGMAILLWFPFALAVPPAALAILLGQRAGSQNPEREVSWRLALLSICVCGIAVLAAYTAAAVALGIHSAASLHEWVASSSHGWAQNKRLLRLATGLPRGFIFLGHDGAFYKRFVLHDPYAHVGLRDLFVHSLWKLGVFYGFAALLAGALWRFPVSRKISLPLLLAAGLSIFFGVAIFEPGSAPRYMPAFIFLFAALVAVMADGAAPKALKSGLAIALGVFGIVNLFELSNARTDTRLAPAMTRLREIRKSASDGDRIVLATNADDLYEFMRCYPFDPLNRGIALTAYDAIEPGTLRTLDWRQEFAQYVLAMWQAGHQVWLSKRLLLDRPPSDAWWTDGDDPHVKWSDLAPFFRQFRFASDLGGTDDFLLVDSSGANTELLSRIASQTPSLH